MIDKHQAKFLDEQQKDLVIESDGAVKWVNNGRYLFSDAAEYYQKKGLPVSVEATEKKRDEQVHRELSEYRERMKNHVPSDEEMYEMRAAFGPGQKIVDVITGQVYRT